jgi:ABC-type Mn2+/Zn2+ transport system permease subunit
MTTLSVIIGTSCAAGGMLLSSAWDLPSGPAIVLLATAVFVLSVLFSPKRLKRVSA